MIAPDSAGRLMAKVVAGVPSTVGAARVRATIAAYYASYAEDEADFDARAALFTPDCRFEDPAGRVVAEDREALRHFFTKIVPDGWTFRFRLERVAVVGDEAMSTSILTVHGPDRTPVEAIIDAHWVFASDGLVAGVRTFFDEEALRDL
jgi:steroid delta-isomerase